MTLYELNSSRYKNVRNITVSKDKNSDFLEFYRNNLNCKINSILPSGHYYIYYLRNVSEEEKELIKVHEIEWI